MEKFKWWQKVLIIIGIILAVLLVFLLGVLIFLTVNDYKPEKYEDLDIKEQSEQSLSLNEEQDLLSWNLGFAALGDNADFFMDGGEMVNPSSKERVSSNLSNMQKIIQGIDPKFLFLQEVDYDSDRSYGINQVDYFKDSFKEHSASYARNYKVKYVPFPIPPIGKVDSGIASFSKYKVSDATRIQLPVPFSWPVSTANLKRCLLLSRIPIADSEKELVLVNLHLEAYDSGEGKAKQTEQLANLLASERDKGNYVIAGGDFNQVFSNVDMSKYKTKPGTWQAGSLDTSKFQDFKALQDSSIPTCRSLDIPLEGADLENFQWYVLDGFIVSDNVEVNKMQTLDYEFKYTDHNPVYLNFTLKG